MSTKAVLITVASVNGFFYLMALISFCLRRYEGFAQPWYESAAFIWNTLICIMLFMFAFSTGGAE